MVNINKRMYIRCIYILNNNNDIIGYISVLYISIIIYVTLVIVICIDVFVL